MTVIVGLGHRARHGKDTVAQMIHELAPGKTRIYSFASALKAWCRVEGFMTKKDGRLLQFVGTEMFRQKDPDIWVRCLQHQIEEEAPAIALIPDMRFPNEKEWVEKNGITVKVERLNEDGSLFIAADRPADHPSEIALSNAEFDFTYRVGTGRFDVLSQAAVEVLAAAKRYSSEDEWESAPKTQTLRAF